MMLTALTVTLDEDEVRAATEIGSKRYRDVAAHRRTNRAALVGTDSEESNHILGALGEAAFAKWLGIPNPGTMNTFRSVKDVAGYEVRARRGPRARLIIRPVDEGIYVLVTPPDDTLDLRDPDLIHRRWRIRGWMRAEDARQHQWEQDPGGRGACWMVPQDFLHPMSLLPNMDAKKEEAHDESPRRRTQLWSEGRATVRTEGHGEPEEQQRPEPDTAEFAWEG